MDSSSGDDRSVRRIAQGAQRRNFRGDFEVDGKNPEQGLRLEVTEKILQGRL